MYKLRLYAYCLLWALVCFALPAGAQQFCGNVPCGDERLIAYFRVDDNGYVAGECAKWNGGIGVGLAAGLGWRAPLRVAARQWRPNDGANGRGSTVASERGRVNSRG